MKPQRIDDAATKPGEKKDKYAHLREHQFKPGNQVAKGKGRPKLDPKLTELCRTHNPACVKHLVRVMNNEETRDRDRLVAIDMLLSYGNGKPKSSVDINAKHDVTSEFLDALKLVNQRAVDQRERNVKMIEADVVEDAVVGPVKSKPKRRVRAQAKQLSAGNGKAE